MSGSDSHAESRWDEAMEEYWQRQESGDFDEHAFLEEFADVRDELDAFLENRREVERHFSGQPVPVPSVNPPPSFPREFGNYILQRELGRGGMGVVYQAMQKSPRRRVAVKMILDGQLASSTDVERFQREAQTAAELEHPNIVGIFEVGVYRNTHYFSMEYVAGERLKDKVLRSVLPAEKSAEYLRAVAESLAFAHSYRDVYSGRNRGVLHRDLTPSNILIDHRDQPKITDFGLTKRIDDPHKLTITGKFLGKPEYVSPEQADGKQLGPTTDVYSLGAVLYELLTGRPPFQSDSIADTLWMVKSAEPVAPCRLNAKIPKDIETICLKCLAKEPQRRYQSAQELADDLGRFLRKEPIHARPVGNAERAWRWCMRNPLVASLWGLLAVAVFAGVSVSVTFGVMASIAANDANEARRKAESSAEDALNEKGRADVKAAEALTEQLRANAAAEREKLAREDAEAQLLRSEELLYASQIESARREWDDGNVQLARHYLNACRWDLRGWEHHYLNSLMTDGHRTLHGHVGAINSLAVSPDGRLFVTGANDDCLKIWDLATGREQLTIRHRSSVTAVAFSPDGQRLASAGLNCVRVFDTTTSKEIAFIDCGHVDLLEFSPNGGGLLTAFGDEPFPTVFDATTGKATLKFSERASNEGDSWDLVKCATFSPDGQRIVSGSKNGMIKVWDAKTGRKLIEFEGHDSDVDAVAFSRDGGKLASGCYDGTLKIWDPASSTEVLSLKGHNAGVTDVSFSPDDKRLVSASRDTTLKIWDLTTGAELSTLRGHVAGVNSVAFTLDGEEILSGSRDATIKVWNAGERDTSGLWGEQDVEHIAVSPGRRWIAGVANEILETDGRVSIVQSLPKLWDATTGRVVMVFEHDTDAEWRGGVTSVAVSENGQRVATGSSWGVLRLWDARTGSELKSFTVAVGNVPEVTHVAFSPDGRRVAGASYLNVKVWDTKTGKRVASLEGHECFAFSPDGRFIASAANNIQPHGPNDFSIVKVWNIDTGEHVLTLKGHTREVTTVAFSPDGILLVSGSYDDGIMVRNAETGKELFTCDGHTEPIACVAFSPDGERIISGSVDQTLRVWNAETGRRTLILREHKSSLATVHFSHDGRHIVSTSDDGVLKTWSATRRQEPRSISGGGNCLAISPDGQRVVTGSGAWLVELWDLTTGQHVAALKGHATGVNDVAFSPDGHRIVSASGDRTIKLWDADTGLEVRTFRGHESGVNCVAFTPNGEHVASGSDDETVKMWNAASGEQILTLKGHTAPIFGVAFSPDGERLASGSGDGSIRVWQTATGREVRTLKGHTTIVYSVAFSPDGTRIASASHAVVKAWNASTGQETMSIKAHNGWVNEVAFLPDNDRIVSASDDGSVKIWDTTTGKEAATLHGHTDRVKGVAVCPDGQRIVSASTGQMYVWDVSQGP